MAENYNIEATIKDNFAEFLKNAEEVKAVTKELGNTLSGAFEFVGLENTADFMLALTDSASAGIGTFTQLAGAMQNISSLASNLPSAFTGLMNAFKTNPFIIIIAGVAALVVGFATLYQKSEVFRNAVNALASGALQLFNSAMAAMAPVIDSIKEKFGVFIEKVKELGGGLLGKIGPMLDKMGGSFGKMGAVLGIAGSMIAKFGMKLLGIGGPIGMLIGLVVSFVSAWLRTGELNSDGISQVVENMTTMITNIADFIAANLPMIMEAGTKILTSLMDGIIQALPTIVTAILTIINTFVDFLVANLPMIIDAGLQILTALIGGIIMVLPMLISAALDIVMALFNALVENLPMIIDAGLQLLMSLVNALIDNLPMLLDAAILLITKLVQALIDNLPQIIDAGIKLLLSLVDGIIKMLPVLIDAALKLIMALANGLIDNLPQILSAAGQLIAALINAVVTLGAGLLQAGWKLVKGLVQGIGDKIGDVVGKAGEMITQFITKIVEFKDSLVSKAKDFVGGFIKGIKDSIGNVVKAAGEMAKAAVDKVKSWLHIGSPSKLMRKMGAWTGEGFLNGLDSMTKPIAEVSAQMADAAIFDVPTMPTVDIAGSVARTNRSIQASVSHEINQQDSRLASLLEKALQKESVIVLDTGVVVGETAPMYDNAFGRNAKNIERLG